MVRSYVQSVDGVPESLAGLRSLLRRAHGGSYARQARAHVGSVLEAAVPMGQSGKGIRNAATSDVGSALPALLIAGLPTLAWSLQRPKTANSILSAPNHLPIQ